MKKFLVLFCFALQTYVCSAQVEQIKSKPLQLHYYFGLQANQLLKQLLNLSNSAAITNPYLFTFSVHSDKYFGLSVQGGVGYSYQDINDVLSPANHESKINEVFYRYGIGKNFYLGTRWEAGVGLDITGDYKLDKTFGSTVTTLSQSTDSVGTVTINKTVTTGYGAQLSLGFHISNHVLLGTEATFYYSTSHQKQNGLVYESVIGTTNHDNDTYSLSATNQESKLSNFVMTVPVAIFLIVKI